MNVEKLIEVLREAGGGGFGISYNPEASEDTRWAVSAMFGREAPDSPMSGGATHGLGSTPEEAYGRAMKDLL